MIVIPNIVSSAFIREQAAAFDADLEMLAKEGAIRQLSVGRFTETKNFDIIPDICWRIREQGVNVIWYIIGYGGDEDLIRRRITEAGKDHYVRILGKKTNPYPYMKACDIYVQPSRYEGCPVSIQEAFALGKTVIATTFLTVNSIFQDGVNGHVVPLDNEGCARGIIAYLY